MKPRNSNRRVLHQPLFPIQWTPPPPPPLFSPNPLTTTTTAFSPTHKDSSTTKTAIIATSTTVGLVFLLSLLHLILQHRASQSSLTKTKRETSFAPAGDNNSEVGSSVQLSLNHPSSPELTPLPPLLTNEAMHLNLNHPSPEIRPLPPLPRQPPVEPWFSDEDIQPFQPKISLERSNSWNATTPRFSIGSSPNLTQQQLQSSPDLASKGKGMHSSEKAFIWGRFKSRSLRLDDDMIEIRTSFGKEMLLKEEKRGELGVEKAESIEILLRSLNVTAEDVCGALLDGSSELLGTEFLDSLVKLAPTKEEEFLLRHYKGEVTTLNLAERFLKAVLDVPFAMKRIDVMLYQARFETQIDYLKKSFQSLQDACQDLRRNNLFLKLLEAITGTTKQIDTDKSQETKISRLYSLLTLCNAKGEGGKATLLHCTVQDLISNKNIHSDMIREEECKRKGLKAIAGLSAELEYVIKAAEIDLHLVRDQVKQQELQLEKVRWLLQLDKACSVGEKFFERMKKFANEAEMEIESVKEEETATLRCIRETTEYFEVDSAKEAADPLKIFVLVRDFLLVLEGVCRDLERMQERAMIGSLSGCISHFSPVSGAVS